MYTVGLHKVKIWTREVRLSVYIVYFYTKCACINALTVSVVIEYYVTRKIRNDRSVFEWELIISPLIMYLVHYVKTLDFVVRFNFRYVFICVYLSFLHKMCSYKCLYCKCGDYLLFKALL